MNMNNEIERLTADLATRAAGLTVTDQVSASEATELILAGKDMIKKIKVFFTPLKDAARTSWQGIVDKEKAELAKVEPIVDALNKNIASWRAEEQRKWDAAEAERLRIEREKKRLEEDVLRKAKEAEEKAERERRRLEEEAERLNKEAAKKTNDEAALKRINKEREKLRLQAEESRRIAEAETDKAIDAAAKAEAALAPAPIIPEAPKTSGLAMRDNWCFEIMDPAAVPEEYKVIDEVKLGKDIRKVWGQIKIPGVRIFNQPYMAEIGKRNKV
jgi:hypothetical protein